MTHAYQQPEASEGPQLAKMPQASARKHSHAEDSSGANQGRNMLRPWLDRQAGLMGRQVLVLRRAAARGLARGASLGRFAGVLLLASLFAAGPMGCINREIAPLGSCVTSASQDSIAVAEINGIDVLFVIDKSGSMEEEQDAIAREIPKIVEILTTGRSDDPSVPAFTPPVNGVRIAVASTDMGISRDSSVDSEDLFKCNEAGDDGRFITALTAGKKFEDENGEAQDCPTLNGVANVGDPFLDFVGGDDLGAGDQADNERKRQLIACRAQVGSEGCGYEQQLESMLKSITPPSSDIEFRNTGAVTKGQAGPGLNGSFVRDDALLVVIMVTDEDDCSTDKPEDLFVPNDGNGPYATPVGEQELRCHNVAGADGASGRNDEDTALYKTQRYVEGLIGLKEFPGSVVYSVITGVDAGLVEDQENFTARFIESNVLSHESLEKRVIRTTGSDGNDNPISVYNLEPSCSYIDSTGKESIAKPPRRIVDVARGVAEAGGTSVVQSICSDDYSGAVLTIVKKVAQILNGSCLSRSLQRTPEGLVNCEVFERLPLVGAVTTCEEAGAGHNFAYVDGGARQVCKVTQFPASPGNVPTEPGWFYDYFTDDLAEKCPGGSPARAAFTDAFNLVNGSTVSFNCLVPTANVNTNAQVGVGSPCDGNAAVCNESGNVEGLVCYTDTVGSTCQVPCQSNADCDGVYVCDEEAGICVNPICGASTIQTVTDDEE